MSMKIEQAMKILKREQEFLGITWEQLKLLCMVESSALKLVALDAWDAYLEHEELS